MKFFTKAKVWGGATTALLALTLAGCAAPAESGADAEREAGFVKIEACFTNELEDQPVTLRTLYDGTGVQWEGTVRPGSTACTQTKSEFRLFGEMSRPGDSNPYTFGIGNPNLGYPVASVVVGSEDSGEKSGPGMCKRFEEHETGVLDSGATRFTVQRLADSDKKRFTVKIQPTESLLVQSQTCNYRY